MIGTTPWSSSARSVCRADRKRAAVGEVVVREQHLPDRELVRGERVLPLLHEARLTDRGGGLQRGQLGRARR